MHASSAKEGSEKHRKRWESCFKINGLWFADNIDLFVPEDFASYNRNVQYVTIIGGRTGIVKVGKRYPRLG